MSVAKPTVRRKRNFKGLQLADSPLSIPVPRIGHSPTRKPADAPLPHHAPPSVLPLPLQLSSRRVPPPASDLAPAREPRLTPTVAPAPASASTPAPAPVPAHAPAFASAPRPPPSIVPAPNSASIIGPSPPLSSARAVPASGHKHSPSAPQVRPPQQRSPLPLRRATLTKTSPAAPASHAAYGHTAPLSADTKPAPAHPRPSPFPLAPAARARPPAPVHELGAISNPPCQSAPAETASATGLATPAKPAPLPGFNKKPPGLLKKRAPKNLKLQLGPEALNIGGGAPAGLEPSDAPLADVGATPLSRSTASGSYHKLSEQLASLELTGTKRKPGEAAQSLSNDDLEFICELGAGNGGTVAKVRHIPTGQVFAKKVVFVEAKPAVRKQIVRELQIMHECDAPFIIDFVGAYLTEPHISMCMEYMDRGSLDQIYKRKGPIPYAICARVASVVVHGLTYLYDVHRIIHRDVKPSNILASSRGELKICDFGVSGELINSIADTFVGTSTYMSPERIQGGQYTVKSDVWSLGVTLIELALGRFPFSDDDENGVGSILDLLQHIVNEPSPRLPDTYPAPLRSFTDACLAKAPLSRAAPKALLQHELLTSDTLTKDQLAAWLNSP